MSKKEIKMHQKGPANGLYQAARMAPSAKTFANKQVRKAPKQSKKGK